MRLFLGLFVVRYFRFFNLYIFQANRKTQRSKGFIKSNKTEELSMVDINKENPLDATIKIGKIKNIEV